MEPTTKYKHDSSRPKEKGRQRMVNARYGSDCLGKSDGESCAPKSVASDVLSAARAGSDEAWRNLVSLYGPQVYHWARQSGMQDADAADVVQQVFIQVNRSIDGFRRDAPGQSFTAWLRTICRRRVLDLCRRKKRTPIVIGGDNGSAFETLSIAAAPTQDDEADSSAAPPAGYLYRRALDILKPEFSEQSWQAFQLSVVQGMPAKLVAEDLKISINAVYIAKSRIRKRIRDEFALEIRQKLPGE